MRSRPALAFVALAAAPLAHARPEIPDKSAYTLLNPTPPELMRPMSTDRPDTTESPYTVDAGHVQIELSLIDYTVGRRNDDGVKTEAWTIAPTLLKIGLLNNVDLQLGIDPYTRSRTTDRATGASEVARGFGSTVLRLKWNLWGNDEGDSALALMPYASFPTSSDDLGADRIEYGLIVPFALALPHDFSLGLMGEIDVIRSEADDRYVIDFLHTATISRDLIGDLAGFIEYAGFANLNHNQDYRAYVNTGLTYAVTENLQLDAGLRFGLTKAADDFGLFTGMSVRF